MSADIATYRQVTSDAGYIKAGRAGKGLTQFGTGFLGKITAWFRGRDAETNKTTKANFVSALNKTYGEGFVKSKALNNLLGDEINGLLGGERYSKEAAKPLSARLVQQIIQVGDRMLAAAQLEQQVKHTVRLVDNPVIAHSSYQNSAEIHKAATSFSQQAKFGKTGSALMAQIGVCLNKPTDENLKALAKKPGGDAAVRFVEAFKENKTSLATRNNTLTGDFVVHCLNIKADAQKIGSTASKQQFPLRLGMMCQTLAEIASKDKGQRMFEHALRELITYTDAQVDILKSSIRDLSRADIIPDGMSKQDVQNLAWLKDDATIRLNELLDPNGLCQHVLAFAIDAASDPASAYATMKAVMPQNA